MTKKGVMGGLGKRKGFNLPIISTIDLEEEKKILEELEEEERRIINKDQKRLLKKWESKKFPSFRLTGEYLLINAYKGELNKKEISKNMKIQMGTLNMYLSELNRFDGFKLRFIAKIGKKDIIQLCTESKIDFDKWNGNNTKGIISRTKRVMDTRKHVEIYDEIKIMERIKKIGNKNKIKVSASNSKEEEIEW